MSVHSGIVRICIDLLRVCTIRVRPTWVPNVHVESMVHVCMFILLFVFVILFNII